MIGQLKVRGLRRLPVVALVLFSVIAIVAPNARASAGDAPFQLSVAAGRMADVTGTPATQNYVGALGVATDASGNFYIADNHGYVEKIAPDGTLTIIAGNGTDGEPVAGPATSSPLAPDGVGVDPSGNVYIADTPLGDTQMGYVLKVTPDGTLSIFAGNGSDSLPAPGPATGSGIGPLGLATDAAGNVYVAGDNVVAKITPTGMLSLIAGDENGMTPPAPGVALATEMNPVAVAVDAVGNIYIADETYVGPNGEGRVERVTPAGSLTVIAGDGGGGVPSAGPALSSHLNPTGVALDGAGNVYVTTGSPDVVSFNGGYLVKVTAAGQLSVVSGDGSNDSPSAGPAASTAMNPVGVATDAAGDVFVADSSGYRAGYALKIAPDTALSVVAGDSGEPEPGPATAAHLNPIGVAVDSSGDIYIADPAYVEKVTPNGVMSIFAGNGTAGKPIPGPATSSPLEPDGVAVDSLGNVYVSDYSGYVEKVTPAGTLSVVAGSGGLYNNQTFGGPATTYEFTPVGVTVDNRGNIYVADGTVVFKVDPSDDLTLVAGNGRQEGYYGSPAPGPATASPMQPVGVSTDADGNLYIADRAGWIEKVTPNGTLSVIAGAGPYAPPGMSRALTPTGVTVDSANDVFIADAAGYVEELTSSGALSTIAGNGAAAPPTPGPATASAVDPNGIAVDPSGSVYISDDQTRVPTYSHSPWDQGFVDKITPATPITVPPPSQPSAVTELAAVAQPGAPTTFEFSWHAAAPNGAPVTGYTLSCGADNWSVRPGSDYIVSTVQGGFALGQHLCTVTAANAIGDGPAAEVTFVASMVPSPVSNFAAAPSGSNVLFTWSAASPNGSPISHYTLRCGSRSWAIPPGSSNTVAAPESGFSAGSQTCAVTASNGAGTSSASSTTFEVILPPGAPTSLAAHPSGSSFVLTWSPGPTNGAPISSYEVTCKLAGGRVIGIKTSALTVHVYSVLNGTQRCAVNSGNSAGAGPQAVITFVIAVRPSTPAHVYAAWVYHGSRLLIWWSPSNGHGSPVSYVITDGHGHRWTRTTTNLTINRPARGRYRYVVQAVSHAGRSGTNSVTVSVS